MYEYSGNLRQIYRDLRTEIPVPIIFKVQIVSVVDDTLLPISRRMDVLINFLGANPYQAIALPVIGGLASGK